MTARSQRSHAGANRSDQGRKDTTVPHLMGHHSAENTGAAPRALRGVPLSPVEIATVGILSGLAIVCGIFAVALPVFPEIFKIMCSLPMAMIAVRGRRRAVWTAIISVVLLALMLGGLPTVWTVGRSALIGAVAGLLVRGGSQQWKAILSGVFIGLLIASTAVGLLLVLSDMRSLFIDSIRVTIEGYLKISNVFPVLTPVTDAISTGLTVVLDYWWLVVFASMAVKSFIVFLLVYWVSRIVIRRLHMDDQWDPLQTELTSRVHAVPDPLPTTLRDVTFEYPGDERRALDGIDLTISKGEFTVVVGANGSGKSTLALILAGALPSSGTVFRPGDVGLGMPGGVALVAQRSELQMLGETVVEDLLWGLDEDEQAAVDAEAILASVGLDGQGTASTRHLSGGQRQRLSLGAALLRRPTLLISDETTAMVDKRGRTELLEILKALPARGTSVVHVTHDPLEARHADRLVRLEHGRVVYDGKPGEVATLAENGGSVLTAGDVRQTRAPYDSSTSMPTDQREARPEPKFGAMLEPGQTLESMGFASVNAYDREETSASIDPDERLWADRVRHTFDVGTPWEKPVLEDVSMIVNPGDAVLITGGNGSGKTTLARILTGLVAPTWGKCSLGGKPMVYRVGSVAYSMQFARLQLQRPSVRTDILAAAHVPDDADAAKKHRVVAQAMEAVGLPLDLAEAGVDELSGGQMRRVALAGLLASKPRFIVLDEPLAGLDEESRQILVETLKQRKAAGTGLIVISHDTDEMEAICERHLELKSGVLT